MLSSQLQWKNWLAPAGVTLVSIWSLYFCAANLFFISGESSEGGQQRSSERNKDLGERITSNQSRTQLADEKEGAEQSSVVSPVVETSDRVKKYQSARRALALSKISGGSALVQRSPKKRSATLLHGDSSNLLLDQILNEAYRSALHSQKPWLNLIAISAEYKRNGERQLARDVLMAAEKLAVDPDNVEHSSSAVRDVAKAMLSQKQNDDAMAALENIRHPVEREKAMAEVAVWAARDGRLDIAKALVTEMTKVSSRDIALVAIAENQASYEDATAAFRTAESISNEKKKNDTYRRIAMRRAASKDFAEAELAIAHIKDVKMMESALTALARQRARSGDIAGGMRTLLQINDPATADASLRSLSDELAKSGWFSGSAYVATRIENEREKSYALEKLSVELAKSGDVRMWHLGFILIGSVI